MEDLFWAYGTLRHIRYLPESEEALVRTIMLEHRYQKGWTPKRTGRRPAARSDREVNCSMAKKSFYEIGPSEGYLRKGSYLEVRRQINYRGDRADFKPFLNVPVKDLEKQLKESQAEEKKVFEEMKKAVTAWDEHGAQTLLLQKAIEYLKTPEVTHTRNEWQRHKDGSWEISNLVYKMTFNIVKSGDEWKLTWELSYTAPRPVSGVLGLYPEPQGTH